jgi:hypothetical protein
MGRGNRTFLATCVFDLSVAAGGNARLFERIFGLEEGSLVIEGERLKLSRRMTKGFESKEWLGTSE